MNNFRDKHGELTAGDDQDRRSGSNRHWTAEEIQSLIDLFNTGKPADEIAAILDRQEHAVSIKIYKVRMAGASIRPARGMPRKECRARTRSRWSPSQPRRHLGQRRRWKSCRTGRGAVRVCFVGGILRGSEHGVNVSRLTPAARRVTAPSVILDGQELPVMDHVNPYSPPVDVSKGHYDHSLLFRIIRVVGVIAICFAAIASMFAWQEFRSGVRPGWSPAEQLWSFATGWQPTQENGGLQPTLP